MVPTLTSMLPLLCTPVPLCGPNPHLLVPTFVPSCAFSWPLPPPVRSPFCALPVPFREPPPTVRSPFCALLCLFVAHTPTSTLPFVPSLPFRGPEHILWLCVRGWAAHEAGFRV